MSKYSTAVATTELDARGLSKNAGWITIYHINPQTREYSGATYDYLMAGVGIPAGSYIDAPELPDAGLALRRSDDGTRWEPVPDYRGQTVYSTDTRQAHVVTQFGELPDNVTLLKPASEFVRWSGKKWVTDKAAQAQALVIAAQRELAVRQSAANTRISTLSDAVALEIATDNEKAALVAWQTYRVLLSRIDVNATDIDWPLAPGDELIATADQ